MSAPAAPATDAPKKKGKLPIILAAALVLGGGGFFMMKGGKKKEPPKVALVLAEHETELEEFLTNTANPANYVKAKISVRLTKDYAEEKFKNNMGDVRDAVLGVLNATPTAELTDVKRRPELKKRLAEAMNTALEGELEHPAEDEAPKPPRRKGHSKEKPTPEASADWDSGSGPVLQVRFGGLATQ